MKRKHTCPCDGDHFGYLIANTLSAFCVVVLGVLLACTNIGYEATTNDLDLVCSSSFGSGSEFKEAKDGHIFCTEPDRVEKREQTFVIVQRGVE